MYRSLRELCPSRHDFERKKKLIISPFKWQKLKTSSFEGQIQDVHIFMVHVFLFCFF